MKMLVAIRLKNFNHLFPLKIATEVDVLDFTQRDVSRMLFTIESSFCALSTCFEPLYTNMYLIGPSDGAVSRYALRLKIYEATSVKMFIFQKFFLSKHVIFCNFDFYFLRTSSYTLQMGTGLALDASKCDVCLGRQNHNKQFSLKRKFFSVFSPFSFVGWQNSWGQPWVENIRLVFMFRVIFLAFTLILKYSFL